MGWELVAGTLGLLIIVAAVVILLVRRQRSELLTDSEAEDFLTEYFALEEFDDDAVRERLEHLRGAPDLR